mmetsp:Transcript_5157/g.10698  ORF Transcript_5157/g.10698 Transcript_5157/m.10698 type:complete len:94 (+) Transcript_5157:1572-1853(+)
MHYALCIMHPRSLARSLARTHARCSWLSKNSSSLSSANARMCARRRVDGCRRSHQWRKAPRCAVQVLAHAQQPTFVDLFVNPSDLLHSSWLVA